MRRDKPATSIRCWHKGNFCFDFIRLDSSFLYVSPPPAAPVAIQYGAERNGVVVLYSTARVPPARCVNEASGETGGLEKREREIQMVSLREKERERETGDRRRRMVERRIRERGRDRQTDRQTDGRTDGRTKRQTDREQRVGRRNRESKEKLNRERGTE